MMYSDTDILQAIKSGELVIEPLQRRHISGATVDLTLHPRFRVFHTTHLTHIDVKKEFDVTEPVEVAADGSFILHPGEFVLGSVAEKITLSAKLAAIIEGRSSLGRIGLIVHATASLVEPNWSGPLTLEMSNISSLPIKLYAGMRIAKLAVIELKSPASDRYNAQAKYQNQEAPTPSRIWQDFQPQQD